MNIPNILSVIRIILIPIFTIEFVYSNNYFVAGVILVVSGITDCLDGYIARRFNMITDIGKVLDPIADKLTQLMAVFCLAMEGHIAMWILFAFLAFKDIALVIGGIAIYKKKDVVVSSNRYGKIATIIFYIAVTLMVLFHSNITETWTNLVGALLILAGAVAFGGYISYFFSIKSKKLNKVLAKRKNICYNNRRCIKLIKMCMLFL